MKKLMILGLLALVGADLSAREPLRVPSQELALAAEPTLVPEVQGQGPRFRTAIRRRGRSDDHPVHERAGS